MAWATSSAPAIAGLMEGGGVLAYLVLIPMIQVLRPRDSGGAAGARRRSKLIADMIPSALPRRVRALHRRQRGGRRRES